VGGDYHLLQGSGRGGLLEEHQADHSILTLESGGLTAVPYISYGTVFSFLIFPHRHFLLSSIGLFSEDGRMYHRLSVERFLEWRGADKGLVHEVQKRLGEVCLPSGHFPKDDLSQVMGDHGMATDFRDAWRTRAELRPGVSSER
jgi:hypothetical protein